VAFVFQQRPSDSPLVQSVYRTESGDVSSFLSVATIYWAAVVTKQRGRTRLTLRGPETRATRMDCPEDAEFLGILFKPGTFMPDLPAQILVDAELDLPQATSKSFWLKSSAWEFPNFENVDDFVARLVRAGLVSRDPIVDKVLQGRTGELSPRSAQRRFLHATGLTHKDMRMIRRAQRAAHLLQEGSSILDTVDEAGYFDQAHLTRSLKRFIGQTPAQLVRVPAPKSIF
jgi:AraC-like DNA-binding protein